MTDTRDATQSNRLIAEKSPYLLQHAYNPVDWYPWGEEAFAAARQQGKPIFLSIGYSTCHWCHVMERESFEDPEIAGLMNDLFINIKVDREERPDIDRVYMTTVQALTGHGGWPLSVWLTPDLEPFFGGTYFPPRSHYGRPGFPEILRSIGETWRQRRDHVEASAEKIVRALGQQDAAFGAAAAFRFADRSNHIVEALDRGYAQLARSYDRELGGFSEAPKFPRPSVFWFLLRHWARTGEPAALEMTLETLRKMWAGGDYDHLGGGFHRYSVDAYWRIPHFEKMLYDQAQMVVSLIEAHQITAETFFADVAREVLDYVLRDLTDPDGGFYSAQDADSAVTHEHPQEKEEGAFYLWTREEVVAALGEQEATVFIDLFGISEAGNAISDPTGELGHRNVLYRALTAEQAARRFDRSPDEIEAIRDRGMEALRRLRRERPRPHLDDKVITAWNGLMISAFARAGAVLGERRYTAAAARAATFVETRLFDPQAGRLWRRYRDGEARHPAQLEDYALLVQGLLDLWEGSFDPRWLKWAIALTETQRSLFADASGGGFFDTSGEDASVILRTREVHDGAEPSGNAVAASNLFRLAALLDRPEWKAAAERTIGAVERLLVASPISMPQMMATIGWALESPRQIVIVGTGEAPDTRAMLAEVERRFLPFRVLVLADGRLDRDLGPAIALYDSLEEIDGRATAYVCENFACQLPTNDPETLAAQLDEGVPE